MAANLSASRPPATTRTGRSSAAARSGLSGPNGFAAGWSLVAPTGNDSLQNLSTRSRFGNASAGHSASDEVRRTPPKNGIIKT
nr:unnamed protein product [Digitaria exilis]